MMKKILDNHWLCVFLVSVLLIMAALHGLTNEYCCEVGENVGLQKRYQELNKINEDRESNGNWCKSPTYSLAQCAENKYQRDQTYNNNMPGNHVCKKTYDQGKGLCEDAQNFHEHQDWFHSSRNGWV